MKTNLITLFLLFITLHSIGQINFESGYFIDNNNKRVECLIKNSDWKNNPTEFEYKLTTNDETQKGTLITAKEFGIKGFSRFVKADTKIDISPSDIDNLSRDRNPVWSQERIFLKVLVEGKATLYYYENKGLIRFFYSVSDTAINQLIYKEYLTEDNQVAENFKFREQLWSYVRCANASMSSVENIRFNRSELERYFKKFNGTADNSSLVYEKQKKRDSFHLRITPGLNFSSVSVINVDYPDSKTDLGNKINFRIGIEAELILPFNKNKWGLMVEPSYQSFNSSGQQGTYEKVEIKYQSIEFPVGLRHYFFLNENARLFLDATVIPGYSLVFNSKINNLDIGTQISYAFGGGIGYKKWSAEMRYYTNRDLAKDYFQIKNDYTRMALIVGFRIF
ncbi:MAG: outer membrane beta-barrel protein [Bacteroidales bacterium]|nr:outer membrane beta-barrel protein [Bacteroidales bacterium]